jgi:hypothetical protein
MATRRQRRVSGAAPPGSLESPNLDLERARGSAAPSHCLQTATCKLQTRALRARPQFCLLTFDFWLLTCPSPVPSTVY